MVIVASLYRVQMKLAKPFSHARAVRNESDDLVLTLDVDGVAGIGECVPRNYVTGETVEEAFASICGLDLAATTRAIENVSFRDGVAAIANLRLADRLAGGSRPALAAACAVELALLDVLAKRTSVSLRAIADALDLPAGMRRHAESAPIPKSRALDLRGEPSSLQKGLFVPDHVKLKGAPDASFDVARVRAVRELLGDRVTMSIDANMSWTLDEAIARWGMLRPYNVAWFEEPLPQYALADCRTLRERVGARVMLDESLCSFDDGKRAVEGGACDLFNIRVSKNGGLITSLRLAELAHRHEIGIQLGIHPGQMGVLGAAGAHFMSIVGSIVACEGADTWIGTGGLPERIIAEALRFDAETARCDNLGDLGLGVTPQVEVIERNATQRSRWRDGRWLND